VYVYRDTGGQPDDPAAGSRADDPAERAAAYWYDLLSEEPAPMREETRGPFEPLLSSDEPQPAAAHLRPAELEATGPIGTAPDQPPAGATRDQDLDETADARARKLERIKDFYLTAEAIGEQNVDKHFDQLLAQQRELISDYFRQPAAGQAAAGQAAAGQAATGQAATGQPAPAQPAVTSPRDGRADAPEGAGVAADPPRAW
jgi:hypothetical protein